MIPALFCLSVLSLVTSGPRSSGPAPESRPAVPGPQVPNPLREELRVELSAEEAGTPEALTASLYAFVSGPPGQKRNVDRIRSLFHPQARILVVGRHPEKGVFFRPMELEAFLTLAGPQWEKTGLFERGTSVSVQQQDGLAQVWTPYEIRLAADGPALYRGVNALQCAWDGKRWWIIHLEFQNTPTLAPAASPVEPKK